MTSLPTPEPKPARPRRTLCGLLLATAALLPLQLVQGGGEAGPALRGTTWRLVALQDGESPIRMEGEGGRPVALQLAAAKERLGGSGGCNRLLGTFQLEGARLRFSQLGTTRMACQPAVMAFERRYLTALGRVGRWSMDKGNLQLQDAQGRTLLQFRAENPPTP